MILLINAAYAGCLIESDLVTAVNATSSLSNSTKLGQNLTDLTILKSLYPKSGSGKGFRCDDCLTWSTELRLEELEIC